eukprot:TRINITY_DN491_c0_g1_i1.p1 TRINITY_DN491_c0_g1~~TRINITY_DN491_c0_g1_i1.p1  ORF type:complete len:235 (-),score=31.00 TRINITY_DN491_c0_g1_i1:243-947(-)
MSAHFEKLRKLKKRPVNLAMLIFQVIMIFLGLGVLGVSFTLTNSELAVRYSQWGGDTAALDGLMILLRNLAIALSVSSLIVNIGGLAGVIFHVKVILILYIVGCALAMIIGAVCGALPLLSTVFLTASCNTVEETCQACTNSACSNCTGSCCYHKDDFSALCGAFAHKIQFITGAGFLICIALFVCSILGCVSMCQEKRTTKTIIMTSPGSGYDQYYSSPPPGYAPATVVTLDE